MSGPLHNVPSLDSLAADLSQVQSLPPAVAQALWLNVTYLERALALRGFMGSTENTHDVDRLLDIDEASRILGKTKDALYRHSDTLPFTVRDGRSLRFSERGIQKYIRARLRQG